MRNVQSHHHETLFHRYPKNPILTDRACIKQSSMTAVQFLKLRQCCHTTQEAKAFGLVTWVQLYPPLLVLPQS